MTKTQRNATMMVLALLSAFVLPSVSKADDANDATRMTFSGPVEVPGRVLDAGTYWFTLADTDTERNIVQIWNADRSQLITTIIAVPNYRLQPTGKTVVNFEERPVDQPEAIRSWFYPGENYGVEFVYPKARATQLAKQVSRPVLSVRDEQSTEVAALKSAPVKAITPAGDEVELKEVLSAEKVAVPEPPPVPAPASLPQTASSLPLLALGGCLLVAASLGIQAVAKRIG